MFDASSYGTACFLFILQIFWFTEVTASPTKCANADVTVYAELKADIPFVCAAAENTFSFLIKVGLKKRVHIELHIVEEMKELPFRNLYYGIYEKRIKRITVLSYNSCIRHYKSASFCGLRLSRKLHSSFVVHEIAHAIADANLNTETPNIAAQEYIAYTTQLALLADGLRQEILTHINNKGFYHDQEITSLFLEMNPSVFAVKAYRHFSRPENGAKFYMKLISGQCKLDVND
jgi:hypothetical protein